jgi:hypothetical protein
MMISERFCRPKVRDDKNLRHTAITYVCVSLLLIRYEFDQWHLKIDCSKIYKAYVRMDKKRLPISLVPKVKYAFFSN